MPQVSPPVLQIDHLYRVRTANREWLVHFEFQTHYRPDIPGRMVRYAASLYLSHGLPVDCVLVLLAERFSPQHVPTSHAIETPSLSMTLDYRVVRLREIDGAEALALSSPCFLVLMPLLPASEGQLTQAVERISLEPDREERVAHDDGCCSRRVFANLTRTCKWYDERFIDGLRAVSRLNTILPKLDEFIDRQGLIFVGDGNADNWPPKNVSRPATHREREKDGCVLGN